MNICAHCHQPYEHLRELSQPRKDYGYCSLACMEADKEPCPQCGKPIRKHPRERIVKFATRRFCDRHCAHVFYGSRERSTETRQHMAEAYRKRDPEWRERWLAKIEAYYATPEGQAHLARLHQGARDWRSENPEAAAATVLRQHESRVAHGIYRDNAARMIAFYDTPEGDAQKEHYRQLYKGKPRPERVTQKMRHAAREFWDSADGWALREAISEARTIGLPDCPFGPGWNQQRAKIRRRDKRCVVCGTTPEELRRKLDVHHIYARRMFGYIPGENRNYVWANHPANLIAVCQTCHIRLETNFIAVPIEYQERADDIWEEFTTLKASATQSATALLPVRQDGGGR